MKTNTNYKPWLVVAMLVLASSLFLAFSLALRFTLGSRISTPDPRDTPHPARPPAALTLILVPHAGDTPLDRQIIAAQQAVATGHTPAASLDRLGWLFVEKARVSFDPGFYKLAEQCALCLDKGNPGDPGAMLLRGHVLQNLHRFKQAEAHARQLVTKRGAPSDFGLLGDVLADLGQLDGAIAAYQSMMDLRPDSQAHARAAHVRWLKGDLQGALEAMREAAGSIGVRNVESAAWMNTRLALFEFQSGETARAEAACATAQGCVPNFPPTLILRGRMQLAAGHSAEAVETLQRLPAEKRLPEHLWLLAEALRASQQEAAAAAVETRLTSRGISDDPRTVALFLATRGEQTRLALSLAEREMESRADVFTHDAVAWTLAANGRNADAWISMEKALTEGTQDARLFLHAGVITARLGRPEAAAWLARARQLERLLLPSERQHLGDAAKLAARTPADSGGALTATQ